MGDAHPPLSGEDGGLVELLWCGGHVVMHSQAPPRPAVPEQEVAPWFQYPVVDEDDYSLEKDLFSEIFGGMPADGAGRPWKVEDKERGAADAMTVLRSGVMPPLLLTDKAGLHGDGPRGSTASEAGESSVATMGSRRVCSGRNEAQTAHVSDAAGDDSVPLPLSGKEARDAGSYHSASATLTTSSTWSRPSGTSKRKQSEGPSEVMQDVESGSADVTCETAQKPTTAKRRRTAQVHNLSERRRRDRINEKMRALQELVPHCNKTDKASMLDEAIEYLKSLQLQLQLMWAMGGRMAPAPAPVMFPAGAHQYMQRMAAISSRMPPFRTCVYSSNDPEFFFFFFARKRRLYCSFVHYRKIQKMKKKTRRSSGSRRLQRAERPGGAPLPLLHKTPWNGGSPSAAGKSPDYRRTGILDRRRRREAPPHHLLLRFRSPDPPPMQIRRGESAHGGSTNHEHADGARSAEELRRTPPPKGTSTASKHHRRRRHLHGAAGRNPTRTYAIYTAGSGASPPSRCRSSRRRGRNPRIHGGRGGSVGSSHKSPLSTVDEGREAAKVRLSQMTQN